MFLTLQAFFFYWKLIFSWTLDSFTEQIVCFLSFIVLKFPAAFLNLLVFVIVSLFDVYLDALGRSPEPIIFFVFRQRTLEIQFPQDLDQTFVGYRRNRWKLIKTGQKKSGTKFSSKPNLWIWWNWSVPTYRAWPGYKKH